MKRHANLAIFVPNVGCPHRCAFCDQRSISGAQKPPDDTYVRELCEKYLGGCEAGKTEIAFFGGSFTAIERGYMLSLLRAASPFVRSGAAAGIRLSTRPDAIDDEILDLLSSFGVTAIELGAQSMDDAVLLANERGHSADDVRSASRLIKGRGFSLGLQMMIGLFGEKDYAAAAERTANEIIKLAPDTARIYPTLVVEGAKLEKYYRQGLYEPLSVEGAVAITASLLVKFEENGVNVIRAGLHDDPSLRGSLVAGPFHPAFGELCHARAMRQKLEKTLGGAKGRVTVRVAPAALSKMIGQKRENVVYFKEKGLELCVKSDAGLRGAEIKIERENA